MLKGHFEQPKGLKYFEEFISKEEEDHLLAFFESLTFEEFKMFDVVAKRKVKHFGYYYEYENQNAIKGEPIPQELLPLKSKAESIALLKPGELEQCLITYYPEKSSIGWHRDAPQFGSKIVGISLLSACKMQFQFKTAEMRKVYEQVLEPRSLYIISGFARYQWQHHIPSTKAPRYSITFRSLSRSGDSFND